LKLNLLEDHDFYGLVAPTIYPELHCINPSRIFIEKKVELLFWTGTKLNSVFIPELFLIQTVLLQSALGGVCPKYDNE